MKVTFKIVLPNGTRYKIFFKEPTKEWTKEEFDRLNTEFRHVFATDNSMTLSVVNDRGEKEVLVLANDVFRNSYIVSQMIP